MEIRKKTLTRRPNITVEEFFAREHVPAELRSEVRPINDYLIEIYKKLEEDVCGNCSDIEKYGTGSYSYVGWRIKGTANNQKGILFAEIHFKANVIDIHTTNAENGVKIASPQSNGWRLSKHLIIGSKEGKAYDDAVVKLKGLI